MLVKVAAVAWKAAAASAEVMQMTCVAVSDINFGVCTRLINVVLTEQTQATCNSAITH